MEKSTMRKREIHFVEHVFGRQNHLRSLYNIALRGGGKTGGSSMRKEGTRYDKSWTGGVKRKLGFGGQPSASTKPRVKVAAPARCKYTMKWSGKEVPGPAYLHHFGEPLDIWAEPPSRGCRVLKKNGDEDFIYGKKQYLHHSIKDGYCCKSTKPPKSQAQQWIRNLGIPGLIEMAPRVEEIKTYIQLSQARNLNDDEWRHRRKLESKIKAFHQNDERMRKFAEKFNIKTKFDEIYEEQFAKEFEFDKAPNKLNPYMTYIEAVLQHFIR